MTTSVIKPIEVTEAVLTTSGIPEPDIAEGEVAWEAYESKRVIIEPIPQPSTDRSFFGVHYNDTVHNTARYFFYVVEGATRYFVGLDVSLSEVFKVELTTDPSLVGTQDITGIHVNDDGLVTVFWRTLNTDYKYTFNTFNIPSTGSPTYNNNGTELVDIDQDLKSNGTLTNFTSSDFGYIVWSSFDTGQDSWSSTIKVITNTGKTISSIDSSRFITGIYGDVASLYTIDSTVSGKVRLIKYSKDLKVESENNIDQYNNGGVGFLGGGSASLNIGLFSGSVFANNPVFEVISKSTLDGVNLYKKGDQVVYLPNHTRYQSLIGSNKSNPSETATEDEAAEWIEVGPSNRWAMFDDKKSTKTKDDAAFSFDLKPGTKFDFIAFFGCTGVENIQVQVKNSGGSVVQTLSKDMLDDDAALEWGLDANSPAFINDAHINGLIYADGHYITITITPAVGFDTEVGLVSFGIERYIGVSVSDEMGRNYLDLSEYNFDEFGETKITKRPVVKLNTYSTLVESARIEVVDRFITSIAGQFNIWYADIGNGQSILTYGTYERSPTSIKANNHRNYTITVRSAV